MVNVIKGIKFLGWFFLRCENYDETQPLTFPGGLSTTSTNVENELSVLRSAEIFEDTIDAQTTVQKSDLTAMNIDGRPSHKEPGALVFDPEGRMGIIDIVDGEDAVITTCMSGQTKISTVDGVMIERIGKRVKMWGVASVGNLGAGTASHHPVAFPAGIVMKDTSYSVICTSSCAGNFAQTVCDYEDETTTGFNLGFRNIHQTEQSTDIKISWQVVGELA